MTTARFYPLSSSKYWYLFSGIIPLATHLLPLTSPMTLDCQSLPSPSRDDVDSAQVPRTVCLVGGEGLSLITLHETTTTTNDNHQKQPHASPTLPLPTTPTYLAATALHNATYLLLTIGAGFSVASGLPTYDSMPTSYRTLCDPIQLITNQEQFQDFWMEDCARRYDGAVPHVGYKVLDSWCGGGGRLRGLRRRRGGEEELSPWWIYSSNVDGLFRRFECFKETICEIHGCALESRCAVGIGYTTAITTSSSIDDGDDEGQQQAKKKTTTLQQSRIGPVWKEWNDDVSRRHQTIHCPTNVVPLFSSSSPRNDSKQQTFQKICTYCGTPTRPNVLLFNDTDENVLKDIQKQRDSYQNWEGMVERAVCQNGAHLVILELGCGTTVPAVRREGEEVLRDGMEGLRGQESGGSVTLIRINPKDARCGDDDGSFFTEEMKSHCISIFDTAEKALCDIDHYIDLLNERYDDDDE